MEVFHDRGIGWLRFLAGRVVFHGAHLCGDGEEVLPGGHAGVHEDTGDIHLPDLLSLSAQGGEVLGEACLAAGSRDGLAEALASGIVQEDVFVAGSQRFAVGYDAKKMMRQVRMGKLDWRQSQKKGRRRAVGECDGDEEIYNS